MNPFAFIDPGLAVALGAAASAFAALVAVWQTLLVRDEQARRLKEIAARRDHLRAARTARPSRQASSQSAMKQVVTRLRLLRSAEAGAAVDRLAQAGLRGGDVLVRYMFARLAAPFVCGGLGVLLIEGLDIGQLPEPARLPAMLVLTLCGAYAPVLYVRNRAAKRQKELVKSLPDALDLMVICAEAGLGMEAALTRVAREVGRGASAMADELALTAVELSFLPDRRQALDNLNRRTGLAEVRALVNTLLQTEKYGTPLAQSLRVLSAEYRDQRMMRAEEKAARLPAVMTVPMIVFIMPALFIVLIGPAILRTLDALRSL